MPPQGQNQMPPVRPDILAPKNVEISGPETDSALNNQAAVEGSSLQPADSEQAAPIQSEIVSPAETANSLDSQVAAPEQQPATSAADTQTEITEIAESEQAVMDRVVKKVEKKVVDPIAQADMILQFGRKKGDDAYGLNKEVIGIRKKDDDKLGKAA